MIIEPYYKAFDPQFTQEHGSAAEVAAKKLQAMIQIADGLIELQSQTLYHNAKINAHCDMKFQNVVVDKDGHLRIIDFPSVNLILDRKELIPFERATTFSPTNTAPEDVISRKKKASMEIGEKTDVFALGMMLGEMFGGWNFRDDTGFCHHNPLYILFARAGLTDSGITARRKANGCRKLYNSLISLYYDKKTECAKRFSPNWLERQLICEPNPVICSWSVQDDLPNLFREATDLFPQNRPSLHQFRNRLQQILNDIRKDLTQPTHLMLMVDVTNLNTHRSDYIREACRVFESAQTRHPHITADILLYGQTDADILFSREEEYQMTDESWISTTNELTQAFHSLEEMPLDPAHNPFKSQLSLCLYMAVSDLHKKRIDSSAPPVMNEIHVFSSVLPTDSSTVPFMITGQSEVMALKDIAGLHEDITIYAHYPEQGETADTWYTPCPFASSSGASAPITGTSVSSAVSS